MHNRKKKIKYEHHFFYYKLDKFGVWARGYKIFEEKKTRTPKKNKTTT